MVRVAASIAAADQLHLGEEIERLQAAGVAALHVDVMDGHFVPNQMMGPDLVTALHRATALPLDVHLMVEAPERLIDRFAQAGAAWISVHAESTPHVDRALRQIAAAGARPVIALNPATPVETIRYALEVAPQVLIMTVNPGFSGQDFLEYAAKKVSAVKALAQTLRREIEIEVDGGVSATTAPLLRSEGADILVSGSFLFRQTSYAAAVEQLVGRQA